MPGSQIAHSLAVRNVGSAQNTFVSGIYAPAGPLENSFLNNEDSGPAKALGNISRQVRVQGGSTMTFPFKPDVESVQLMLKTQGLACNARIELFQGPNNDKVVMDVYADNGMDRPFYAIVETPGAGNAVRITNTGSVEFPFYVCVEPFVVKKKGGVSWSE